MLGKEKKIDKNNESDWNFYFLENHRYIFTYSIVTGWGKL